MRGAAILSATAVTLAYFTTSVAAYDPAALLCSSSQFYWPKIGKCLTIGGPATTNKKDKDCGGKDWYLMNGVCVPRYPNSLVPTCPKGRVFHHMICKARCSRVGSFWFGDGRKCVQQHAGGIPGGQAPAPVTPVQPTPTDPTSCPQGQHWDASAATCVADLPDTTCPTNWHYDASAATCLPNADHHQYNPTCLPGYVWSRVTLNCVKLQPVGPQPSQKVLRSAVYYPQDSEQDASVEAAAAAGDANDDQDTGGDASADDASADDASADDASAVDASADDSQTQSTPTPTLQRRSHKMHRIFKPHHKSTLVSRGNFCSSALKQCPARGTFVEQCRELESDPEACGSCDNNCFEIGNIKKSSKRSVDCIRSACQVWLCEGGFTPSPDHISCVPVSNKRRRSHF